MLLQELCAVGVRAFLIFATIVAIFRRARMSESIGVETHIREQNLGVETLAHISEGIAAATGEEFFRSLVKHLADALAVR
jgi:hypothetical protein